MVGVGVIIVGHGWCWCNYSRSMVGVGVIIVGHGWCWCNYSQVIITGHGWCCIVGGVIVGHG